jgi:excisionase family DNA binding protein
MLVGQGKITKALTRTCQHPDGHGCAPAGSEKSVSHVASRAHTAPSKDMSNTPDTTRADTQAIPDPSSRPTITIDEAAALLGVCRASMYQAAREGQCPTVRIGRRILVPTAPFLRMIGAFDDGTETGPPTADASHR